MPELAAKVCPFCNENPTLIGLKTCGRLVCTDAESVAQKVYLRLLKTPTSPSSLLKLLKLRIEMVAEGKQHPSALRPALGWLEEAMSDVEKLEELAENCVCEVTDE